ncbi:hypothetical protein ACS7SF_17200 [Ralstonia sp. 25C]|uniref:hypothetical protein n=1 Tax=Ralstonia sp. 25C TaxID=3447363 RepID=UPI003F7542CE
MKRVSILTQLMALVWMLAAQQALAQGVLAPPTRGQANTLALAAASAGIKQCLNAMSSLSALGIQGTNNNDVLLDWDRKRAGGASSAFSLIGLDYQDSGAAMSVSAVPESDGSCSVLAERISVAPFACATVARQELAGYHATQLLAHMTVYTEAKDPGSSVSLIDAPPGCMVIRRYVKFSTKSQTTGK